MRNSWTALFEKGAVWLRLLLASFFFSSGSRLDSILGSLVAVVLYLSSLLHWAYFFNWGNVPFDLHDWTQTGPYYYFLRQAILTHQLPLHISSPLVSTDRYLARPDTLLSPQALLLAFFQPGTFMLVNVLILASVGFIGLLLIRRRYQLSPAAFSVLFLLFSFNGHITAQFAVGHSQWGAYFLLPFFALLVLDLVERYQQPGTPFRFWRWVLLMALLQLAILLQGGIHFFIWCMIFLAALGVLYPRFFRPALLSAVFSVLLSLLRVLPPAFQFYDGGPRFISGFVTLTDMLAGLVVLKPPAQASTPALPSLGWWEVDMYVGITGLAFLLLFGIWFAWKREKQLRPLFAPLFVLTFFSVGRIYLVINSLPLPLTDSERVTTRFLALVLVVVIVLAVIELQKFLNTRRFSSLLEPMAYFGLIMLLGHDLLQHSRIWRVTNMYALFTRTPVDIRASVSNHPDPLYFLALGVGLAVMLLTALFLFRMVMKEGKAFHQSLVTDPS